MVFAIVGIVTIIKKTCGLIGTKLPEQYKPAELRRFERYNLQTFRRRPSFQANVLFFLVKFQIYSIF
jgi:hypothetical protein